MSNILMIAYYFPPVRVSSGIQRTLKFASYLLDHGWKAQVLTVSSKAYERIRDDQIHEIPPEVVAKRAFALDTARHLSVKGRYFGWLALPDRWVSWCLGGTLGGLQLIYQYRSKIIWSTYPIATAHLRADFASHDRWYPLGCRFSRFDDILTLLMRTILFLRHYEGYGGVYVAQKPVIYIKSVRV